MRPLSRRLAEAHPQVLIIARSDFIVVAHDQAKAPPRADRAETLAWARKELLEVIEKHHPDVVTLRATEGPSGSFERAEMDGVVQSTLYEAGIPVNRWKGPTIRSKFKARTNEDLAAAVSELPALTDKTTKAQKELLVTAAATFAS